MEHRAGNEPAYTGPNLHFLCRDSLSKSTGGCDGSPGSIHRAYSLKKHSELLLKLLKMSYGLDIESENALKVKA